MKLQDLTGQRFGMLLVIGRAFPKGEKDKRTFWECKCDCGNVITLESYHLKHRVNISCGCRKVRSKKLKDMTGKKFGMLTVIKRVKNPYGLGHAAWLCRCECGNEIVADGTCLRRGAYVSCGCQAAERLRKLRYKHGMSKSRLYKIWSCMKNRCYTQSYPEWHLYGGRGIDVCDEWRNDFQQFSNWALGNGYSDDLSIDRINVNAGYSPENCRFVTPKEQANNKRNNHFIEYNGIKHTISEWSDITGLELWLFEVKNR